MTTQKAIKFFDDEILRLNYAPELNGCEMTEEWKEQLEICKMAKDALEKQIPKKPTYEDVGNVYGSLKRTCKNCGDICLIKKDAKPYEHYCRCCGKKFDDWGDTE